MKKFNNQRLVRTAVLIAIQIILSRFCSISAWNIKIGFGFLPVVIAAMLYGPICAAAVGGCGDFIGAILFPIGTYFPGFTVTAALTGFVFGIFLYKKQTIRRIIAAVAFNEVVLSLLLNTVWIAILYASPFRIIVTARLVQCIVIIPVEIFSIPMLKKFCFRHFYAPAGRGICRTICFRKQIAKNP